jgi:hypothetical protein
MVGCVRRSLGLALLSMISGCYPEFGFAPSDAEPADTHSISDTTVVDTAIDGIFPSEDVADSAAFDSWMPDTLLPDTFTPDTFMPPVDTGPPVGCTSSAAAFCRDYEGVSSVISGWDDSYLRGGGVLNLDSTRSKSPTHSMYSFLPVVSTEASANVHKAFLASSATRPMALDFWVYFDVIPTGTGPLVTKITRDAANRGVSIYVGYGTFAVDVNSPTGTVNIRMPGTVSAGRWMHVRFETMLSATTTGWFKLYVDNMMTPALERSSIATTTVTATDTKINVGLYDGSNALAIKAWYDDVAFFWL